MSIAQEVAPGLRERKKLRTRSTLIDVAADLCLRQGYEKTTVEQIAAAADVSPRTFSRYFPTKETVIAAIAEDVDEYVAACLARQPLDIPEIEALVLAHLEALAPGGPSAATAFSRIAVLIQIVNTSSTLNMSAFNVRQAMTKSATVDMIGQRMALPYDHRSVKLVADTWTAMYASSIVGLGTPGDEPINPDVLCERFRQTFAVFTRLQLPWREGQQPDRQPPAGEPAQ